MKTRIIAILILFLMIGGTAYASDITGAVYQATIRITNSSTATTNVAVNFTLNSQYLLDNGFVNASFNNTAMVGAGAADVAYMPGSNSTNPWIVYVPSIGENSQINDTLYMGGDDMDAKLSYFPSTGGMTTSDAAIIELGDNFTITLSDVFIDTTSGDDKFIYFKDDAVELYVDDSVSGTINCDLIAGVGANQTSINQDRILGNGTNSRVGEDFSTFPAGVIGEVRFYLLKTGNPAGTLTVRVRDAGDAVLGEIGTVDVSTVSGWTVFDTTPVVIPTDQYIRILAEYNGGDGANYVRLDTKTGGSTYPGGTYTYYDGSYHGTGTEDAAFYVYPYVYSATVSSISSGEYDITISADASDLYFTVGTESDTMSFDGLVYDNGYDIVSFYGNTVLYAGSQEIKVDGVQKQYVDWDYGTTFTDQSGNGNHATPTFRTTSSDADVSAVFMDFQPYDTAEIGEYSIESESYMITTAPDAPDDLFDTTAEGDVDVPDTLLPGLFNPLLQTATIPVSFFWIMVAFCTAMAGGLIAYGGVTKLRDQTASFASADSFALFIQALVSGVILVIWITATGGTVIPAWIMAPYVIIELAAILLVRRGVA